MFFLQPWYLIVGAVIATIVLLVALAHSNEEDRLLKAKPLILWAILVILVTFLWPIVVLFAFLAAMGA